MASQRLRAFQLQIDTAKRGLIEGAARQRDLARLSRQALEDGRQVNRTALGHPTADRTLVNGNPGRPEDIKPGGVVVHLFAVHHAVIDAAHDLLMKMSPVDTGRYRDSHIMLVNGEAREPPADVGMDDVVTLVNVQPYARKIETVYEAPDGVFEAASSILLQRYGHLAKIEFNYIGMVGGHTKAGHEGNKSEVRYPALIIGPKGRRGRRW